MPSVDRFQVRIKHVILAYIRNISSTRRWACLREGARKVGGPKSFGPGGKISGERSVPIASRSPRKDLVNGDVRVKIPSYLGRTRRLGV